MNRRIDIRFRFSRALAAVICIGPLCGGNFAWAAATPSAVAPGVIERREEQQVSPPADMTLSIPALGGTQALQNANETFFVLRGVVVEGSTVFARNALDSTYASLLGQKVSLADLYAVAGRITQHYAGKGYALSFAIVPAQRISNGTVHIQVVEGYIADIEFEGLPHGTPKILESYASELKASRPLKTADLERYLLLANDLSGYRVRARFDRIADAERGATRLVIAVDREPIDGQIKLSNRGSRALGPVLADGQIAFNGILFAADQLQIHILNAIPIHEMTYASAAFRNPTDSNGLTFESFVSYSRAHPDIVSLRSAGFSSESWIAHIGIEDALLRTRSNSLWLTGGVTAKLFDGDLQSTANSRDRIYLLVAGLRYVGRDDGGMTSANLDANNGLKIFDATGTGAPLASRQTGSAAYSDIHVYAARQQRLGDLLDVVLSGEGQLAGRPLLSSEQCGYGGEVFGRAFDDSEILGNSCIMGSAELRYAPVLPPWAHPGSI